MKRFIAAFFFFILAGTGVWAWAGPTEEVAQLSGPRLKALLEGNAEAYTADYADNAVFQSSFSPFRIEGREAIRAFFTSLFRMYPKRHVFIRQPISRAYNEDLVVQENYAVLNWYNEEGKVETYDTRGSTAWAKIGGKWQIVDQHISRLPHAH
jgi:ketosteroid isomerase-like protein